MQIEAKSSTGWGRNGLFVLTCGAVAVAIAMGVRQGFGVFTQPVSMDLGTGREVFALAIALQNLVFGLVQPVVGAIADRYGSGRVMIVGALIYALGLVLASVSADPLGLNLTLGVLVGIGLSGTTYVTVLGAIGRAVPPERRSIAFGITTAIGSFGMFLFVPVSQGLIDWLDWRGALLALAIIASCLVATAAGIRGKATGDSPNALTSELPSLRVALAAASRYPSYWLLNAGFFVCGFHIVFVGIHLTPYLTDNGISLATAGWALAVIGLANIFGSYFFGHMGQYHSKRLLLALLYTLRAAIMVIFLVLPLTPVTALTFGVLFGFVWLATVPLTSGLVAQMFGTRYLSTLYGIVFLSHQVGGFLGGWLGGYVYDLDGNYDAVWILSIALGLLSALLHLPIRERPAPALMGHAA
ncbi:MAG: MFS transporter [Pseudomonadota bacterium]